MKKIFALTLITYFCLSSATAGTVSAYEPIEKHPIDIAIESKMDADPSTAGMVEAYEWGIKEWDKLLNKNYNALIKKLGKEDQELLRASQREWIKYRDLEFKFNENYWAGFQGTMYVTFPLAFQSNFVRERALRLGYYLEDLIN
jgi:uncharacterized protein YecT (DUF1311 family)